MTKVWPVALILLAIDRWLKNYFWQAATDYQMSSFFQVVTNQQGAFSLPWPFVWGLAATIIILIFVGWELAQALRQKKISAYAWSFILVGAVSNLWDRLTWGAVVDYINLGWWPVFNFSDGLIVGGVITLLGLTFFKKTKSV